METYIKDERGQWWCRTKRQPGGQRVKDLIEYARWILATYGPLEEKVT